MVQKHIRILREFCKKENVVIKEFNLKKGKYPTKIIHFKSIQNKRTLVFIHGFKCDKYFPFVELFMNTLKEGYSVILFDLPEHGENKNVFSLKESANLLSKVISFSKRKLGVQKKDLILIGQSIGGFLALLESPRNSVAGIITISAPYKINPNFFFFLEPFSLMGPDSLRQLNYYSFRYTFPFRFFRKNIYSVVANSKKRAKEMEKEAISYNLLNRIKKSRIPLLQIHGKLDLFVPFSQAKEINENYGGKDKKKCFPFFSNHLNILFKRRNMDKILDWLGARVPECNKIS